MSYANLLAVSCANRAEVFKRFRDFVCRRNGSYDYSTTGIGWTLHDAVYAVDQDTITTNDYFVIFSPGESGDDDLYFRCTYKANYITISGFLYWNNTTHAGVQQYNTGDNWNITDAAVPVLWIYGGLDSVLGISRVNSSSADFMPVTFGKATNTLYSQEVEVSAAALSAGTDVVITVGTVPAGWIAGRKLFIRDTARIDQITITSVTSSTVTATLANSYLAGAKLSLDLGYFCASTSVLGGNCYALITANGTKSVAIGNWQYNFGSTLLQYGNPVGPNGEYPVVPLYIMATTAGYGYLGELKNVYARYSTGITDLDVKQAIDGANYRAFTIYNGNKVMVLEV